MPSMPPKRILITGVTGLIGYATYTRLQHHPEQYEVYGLDLSRQLSDRVPEHWNCEITEIWTEASRGFHPTDK